MVKLLWQRLLPSKHSHSRNPQNPCSLPRRDLRAVLFTAAGSPYPFIGVIVLIVGFLQVNLHLFFKFILTEMPLETYHSPRWWREAILLSTPWLRARWSDAVVKPAAERRAAELRARLGIKFKSDVEA